MKKILAFFIITCWLMPIQAQTDSLVLYNKFMEVSNIYQQAPVNVSFRIERRVNLMLSENDTTSVEGFIYMPDTNTVYMKVMPIEQLVVDSVGILLHHEQQRIYKVSDKEKLKRQFSAYVSNRLKDSTIDALKINYSISQYLLNETPVLILLLRGMLPETSLPAMEIRLSYDEASLRPLWIEHTTRRLIPVNESDTAGFINQYGRDLLYQVQTSQGNFWYILHEEKNKIVYNERNAAEIADTSINNYIQRNAQGVWNPAERFRNYRVIEY